MSKTRRTAGYVLRLAFAAGIIAFLLHSINKTVQEVDFFTGPVQIETGAVYEDSSHPGQKFVVRGVNPASIVFTIHNGRLPKDMAPSGTLVLKSEHDGSAQKIEWQSFSSQNRGMDEASSVFRSALKRWPWWIWGIVLFGVCTVGLAIRWRIILFFNGIDVSLLRSISVTYIGFFFNLFTLGATGGDLVKAYYVTRETAGKKPEAVSTVFIDRLIGMPALTLLAAVTMLTRLDFVLAHHATRLAFFFILAVLAVMVPFFATVFWKNVFERWRLFRMLETKTSFGPLLRRVYEAFYRCRNAGTMLLQTAGISIAMQLIMVIVLWCFGRALGITHPLADYMVAVPAALIVAGLPLTPGGIGVREGALVVLLGEFGMPATQSLPLSLMLLVTSLAWYAAGGFCLLFYKSAGKPDATGRNQRSEVRV